MFVASATGVLLPFLAFAEEIPATVTNAINTAVEDLGTNTMTLVADNLGHIVVIFAAIVGIGLLLKLVRRVTGR